MYFWNVFRGAILLLSYMVFHTLAYNVNDNLCTEDRLILLPKKIYKKCNVVLKKEDVRKAPTVKVPAYSNLKPQNYMLLMLDPDEFPHSEGAYPHWIKTHITLEELESGVTAGPKDVVPFESPSPHSGIHRYQFLLYPQKSKSVDLDSNLALTRLLRVAEFERKNKANSNLKPQKYTLLMLDPDEFVHSDVVYPRWIKTHITLKELESGVTAGPKDVVPFESPSPRFGIHRYQFLLYPEKGKSVVLETNLASTRIFRLVEFEGYNKVRHIMSFQYVMSAERGISAASDLISQKKSSLFMIILTCFGRLLS